MASSTVILVHGFAGSPLAMWPIAQRLRRAGYVVVNWGYPSLRGSLKDHAAQLVEEMKRAEGPLHLVGHSMGAVIVREAVQAFRPPHLRRVVLLAPPLKGSRMANRLAGVLQRLAPLALEMKYEMARVPEALPPGVEVGVIAARFDHLVSVDDTRAAPHAAHRTVNWTHTLPMKPEVAQLVERFLARGTFA